MSNLRMSCEGLGSIDVRVTKLSTPLAGTIVSAQAKTMLQHFPIKSSQQSLVLDFITNGWPEMNRIQNYIRQHQVRAMSGSATRPEIYLWWPQRGINNWSGFIPKMPAGDRRFNPTPQGRLEFLLIDSLLSEKTFTSSIASDFRSLFNSDIGRPSDPDDAIFTPPGSTTGTGPGQSTNVPLPGNTPNGTRPSTPSTQPTRPFGF